MQVNYNMMQNKFIMNLQGEIRHEFELSLDPLGNLIRMDHALESMPDKLAEAQMKLDTVSRQLETAKVEVTKPFAQEAELKEKMECLSALNAMLEMDERGEEPKKRVQAEVRRPRL